VIHLGDERPTARNDIVREKLDGSARLRVLLLLGGLALADPTGCCRGAKTSRCSKSASNRSRELAADRGELQNLVERLNPDHVDPDLATELMRKNLNVAHPDEYVIEIEPPR
jgi:hypothetical protein